MKRTPKLNYIKENGSVIVTLEKDLSWCEPFELIKQIELFKNYAKKILESAVELEVKGILAKYGLYVYEDDEESIEKAFDTLNNRFGRNIEIIDRYDNTEEEIVYKLENTTIIIDKFGMIQCANEVKEVDYGIKKHSIRNKS